MHLNELHPGSGARKATQAGRPWRRLRRRQDRRAAATRASVRVPAAIRSVGFEGGQMPLQRRLPKFGFVSRKARFNGEVRVGDLGWWTPRASILRLLKAAKIVSPGASSAPRSSPPASSTRPWW